MPRYDDTFVDRFLEPWNRHDVDGALALMRVIGEAAAAVAANKQYGTFLQLNA